MLRNDTNSGARCTLYPVEEGAKVTTCGMHELFPKRFVQQREKLSRHVRHCVRLMMLKVLMLYA